MTPITAPSLRYAGHDGFTAVRRAGAHSKNGRAARQRSGHTVVALRGDLDIASAPALRRRLLGTLRHSGGLLILDLSGVTFCDVAGLAVLVGTQRRATGLGISLHLSDPPPQLEKLLRISGLEGFLTVRHSAPEPRPAGLAT
ncbi:STAS domain-containing protein [Actinomadura sp. 21ATH]|uniref:STAS domain-containing protein n=1 Tax=Actinomadura sp. 21ATH TaxID=1735444 RepID=UPI0035C05A0F